MLIASEGEAVYRVQMYWGGIAGRLHSNCIFAWKRNNMSIMSGQKTWLLLGVLAIAGGAAFLYFDPLGLDPLGLKSGDSAAKPAAAPNGHATPAAAKTAVAPAKASISAASAVLPAMGAAPSSAVVAISPASAEVPPPVAPVQALQQPSKPFKTAMSAGKASEPGKTAGRPMKPKEPMKPMDSDLRYCLKLDTDAAIAKCAGE